MGIKLFIRDMDDPDKCRVEGSGFDIRAATEKDGKAFGLPRHTGYHPQIWEAAKYIFGRPPNDMWLSDPTDGQFGGKGFEVNEHWRQGTVRRDYVDGKIVSIDTQPEILSAIRHDNSRNSDPGTFDAHLSREVSDTIERSTSKSISNGFALELSAEFTGKTAATETKIGVKTTYSLDVTEGESESKSNTRTLSAGLGTQVTVDPGEEKRSVLYAAFGKGVFDIRYRYRLEGDAYFYFKRGIPGVGYHETVDLRELRRVLRGVYGYGAPDGIEAVERVTIGVFGDSYAALEDV